MQNKVFLHSISPEKVIRGENAWLEGKQLISNICNKPILLGRSTQTSKLRNCLANDLFQIGINVIQQQLEYDCCEKDIERVYSNALKTNCDGAIPCYTGFHPHMLRSTKYAYVKEKDLVLTAIKEKESFTDSPMNEYASSGTYYFKTGKTALHYCSSLKRKKNSY